MQWRMSRKGRSQNELHALENLPDDILVCGVVQEILVQLEGRHLFCRQQTWLGLRRNTHNLMHASIRASVRSSMDFHEAA